MNARISRIPGRTGFWAMAVLSVLVALASYRFVPAGVEIAMDHMAHNLDGNRLALFAHIAVAPIALAVMPFQFLGRLRASRPGLHRWMGRLYVLAILVSGVAGFQLAFHSTFGPVATAGFATLSVIWLATTAAALYFALKRNFAAHRNWMLRSACLTFAAVTLRLYLPLGLVAGFDFETAYIAISWLCWVPNLIVIELYLAFRRKS